MQRRCSFQFVFQLFSLAMFCAATTIASPAQTLTTLVNFDKTDGAAPLAALIQGTDGNFYGTTLDGGAYGCGTVFKMTPGGTLTTLHSFCSQPFEGTGPQAGLVQATTDGNFYGTTGGGGTYGSGTVFKITSQSPYTLTTLYSFCAQYNCFDGAGPSRLVQGADGNFYGTTYEGGTSVYYGTVFKITSTGTLTTLYSFCSTNCADGAWPAAGLIQATDGNFYGTTGGGGAHGDGTVFKITPGGMLTTLYSFSGYPDGSSPGGALIQATDGNFYGTTGGGGTYRSGTVFEINAQPPYTLTTLYSFCSKTNCADGDSPSAGLIQATDGNFYGTTEYGGTLGDDYGFGAGTVFEINFQPPYALTTLHSFCSGLYCNYRPMAGLVQGTDRNFYGTTYGGGAFGYPYGTVFSLSLASPTPMQLVPVTPCRLVDTRKQYGGDGPIQGGTFGTFNLPQLAQEKDCGNLSSAAAYSLNVTVVPQVPLGYLTVWPTGENQPVVSTLNSVDGRVKANAAIVPAGSQGAVSVFVSNTTDVVLDIDGYFAPVGNSTLAFYPLTPCRVADTRDNTYPQGLGPPYLSGQQQRDLPVLNSPCFQGVSSPAAYSFNMTVVPHVPLGYLTVWPEGGSVPNVSTLNAVTGTVVANAAIVPAGTGGAISTFASNDTDLVVDVNGYFAAPGAGGLSLYPMAPCRVFDTRLVGNGRPFVNELPVQVANSVCGPPSTAQAYVFNATVVPPGPLGYLTLWPDGGAQPGVSTLNAIDGQVTSNMAIVPNGDGSTDAFASNLTQLVLDISAYFAP